MGQVDLAWFENDGASFAGGGCELEADGYAVSEGGKDCLGVA